jgi:xylulokinase
VVLKLATAGNVNVTTGTPKPGPSWFTYTHPVPGLSYHALGTNAAASSLRWLRDTLGAEKLTYAALDAEAMAVPAGAEGLLFHPYLLGERAPYWDPGLRASIVGLRASHTRGHLVRAVLEGVALSLADCLAVLRRNGVRATEARIVGGGARSALWRQIVSDVLDLPLLYPALSDASAGAALLAGVAVGIYASVQDAVARTLRVEAEHVPDARRHTGYRELLAVYQQVQRLLAPVGPELEQIRFQ